jgi:hypothetical protein
MAEAERPSLRSTACNGPTWAAERRAAAAFREEARDVASHAARVGLCHEAAHAADMPAAASDTDICLRSLKYIHFRVCLSSASLKYRNV